MPNKSLNLVAFAVDLICASVLIFVAAQIVLHTFTVATPAAFEAEIRNVPGNFNDFRSYYALGKLAVSSERANLMQPQVQQEWYCRASTPAGADCGGYAPIPYMPFFSVGWVALSSLPIGMSYVVWTLIGVVGFGAAVCLLGFARSPQASKFAPVVIPLCAIASIPVLRCIVLGQSSLVVCALVAVYYLCWIRRWDVLAGICMALTSFKPQFLIYTFLPPIAQKRWRILIAFAIAESALWLASLLMLGPKPLLDWFSAAARLGSTNWDQTWTMLSIFSLYSYAGHTLMMIAWALTYIGGIALVFMLWKRAAGEQTQRLIAMTICVCLLISYSQLYDAILLAVPAVITLRQAGLKNLAKADWREKAWWAALYLYPAFSWLVWLAFGRLNPMSYHSFTLVLIAQTALAVSLVLRPPAANPDVPVGAESPQ